MTTIVIAHRLSTIRHSNVIIVLHNVRALVLVAAYVPSMQLPNVRVPVCVDLCCCQGEVVEMGDHATLLENPEGRYTKLVEAQQVHSA